MKIHVGGVMMSPVVMTTKLYSKIFTPIYPNISDTFRVNYSLKIIFEGGF